MATKNQVNLASQVATTYGFALTGRMVDGLQAVQGQPPAYRSFPPCLPPHVQQPGYETGLWQDDVGDPDVDRVAVRAGRPWGRTGVLRLGLARAARPAIRCGWPIVAGGIFPTAAMLSRLTTAGSMVPAGSNPLRTLPLLTGRFRSASRWPVSGNKPVQEGRTELPSVGLA